MPKCYWCGNEAISQAGHVFAESTGADAVELLVLQRNNYRTVKPACSKCAEMAKQAGWKIKA